MSCFPRQRTAAAAASSAGLRKNPAPSTFAFPLFPTHTLFLKLFQSHSHFSMCFHTFPLMYILLHSYSTCIDTFPLVLFHSYSHFSVVSKLFHLSSFFGHIFWLTIPPPRSCCCYDWSVGWLATTHPPLARALPGEKSGKTERIGVNSAGARTLGRTQTSQQLLSTMCPRPHNIYNSI